MKMSQIYNIWDKDGQVIIFDDLNSDSECLYVGRMEQLPHYLMELDVTRIRGCRIYVEIEVF